MRSGKTLEDTIVKYCINKGITLATAESCSGGLIAHRITNVPGSSAVFSGGIVAYANEVKMKWLGVPQNALSTYGAVSEPVALSMAEGARNGLNTDYGVAVTGIAGPDGGTKEKPVGTVYIAVAEPSGTHATRCHFSGDRAAIKAQTSEMALTLLREALGAS